MKTKIFAVIDTNVLISSTISQHGSPAEVLNLTESGNIIPIFDERMLREYNEVLHYDKFSLNEQAIYDTLYPIVNNGILINDIEQTKKYFQDNSDIPFYEVTMSSDEFDSYLVTGNIKHFPKTAYIVDPHTLLQKMSYMDNFLLNDDGYNETIDNLIESQITSSKYTSGKDLIDDLFDTKNKTVNLSSRLLRLQCDAQQLENRMVISDSQIDDITKK